MSDNDNREWVRNVRVCDTADNPSCYVLYETQTHRLRLTNRGTWSADDMDIYWPTRGAAYGALAVAPCPLDDPYARIRALEAELSTAKRDLERESRPWSVLLSMPCPVDHYTRHDCNVIDVGYSDRVLIVGCDEVAKKVAALEAACRVLAEECEAGREKHSSEVNLRRRDGCKCFRRWHDALKATKSNPLAAKYIKEARNG